MPASSRIGLAIQLLDPEGRTRKIELKCYGNILGAYREHPEAKFFSSDGKPCGSLTRGLLKRSHIVANVHRYIGKETSLRWEQGDDISMVDFRCTEYSDGRVVADKEMRKRIVAMGIRKVARNARIHSDTVTLIARGSPVKPSHSQKYGESSVDKPSPSATPGRSARFPLKTGSMSCWYGQLHAPSLACLRFRHSMLAHDRPDHLALSGDMQHACPYGGRLSKRNTHTSIHFAFIWQ